MTYYASANTGFIEPNPMNDEEEAEVLAIILRIRPVVYALAEKIYGEFCIKQFRKDYKAGCLNNKINESERKIIDQIKPIESRLLGGFVLFAVSRARTYDRSKTHPALDYDDYFNEACLAITDAAWSFDGQVSLSTYVGNSIKNRLIDVARLGPLSMISPKYYRLRSKLNEQVNANNKLDEILERMEIRGESAIYARRAMAGTLHASQRADERYALEDEVDNSETENGDWDLFQKAVGMTPLTELQKDLFDAFFSGVEGFQAEIARQTINKKTGKPYTRANCGQQWKKAMMAVKEKFEELDAA